MAHGGFHSLGYSWGYLRFFGIVLGSLCSVKGDEWSVLFIFPTLPPSLDAFNKISRTFRHSFMLLAFIWMLLGRTGASAVVGKRVFSCPFPPLYQLNLGVIMENSKVTASCLNQWFIRCTNGPTRSR